MNTEIRLQHLASTHSLTDLLAAVEWASIHLAMTTAQGNKAEAARLLQINRTTLTMKMRVESNRLRIKQINYRKILQKHLDGKVPFDAELMIMMPFSNMMNYIAFNQFS